jgi:hypothetical protein
MTGFPSQTTATRTGRVADMTALLIDSSGTQQVFFKWNPNEKSIKLLQSWIEQYGSERDPDLDQQMRELGQSITGESGGP